MNTTCSSVLVCSDQIDTKQQINTTPEDRRKPRPLYRTSPDVMTSPKHAFSHVETEHHGGAQSERDTSLSVKWTADSFYSDLHKYRMLKMPATLNLSNEVVKMRAVVKRVKVFIIRKLTRQIVGLKKKKGTEVDLERNQRRASRLLEEIRVLKALAPDSVTKAALQSDISFEKLSQNKDCSLSERATARIATHTEFSGRIRSIKNAVEAFKAERTSAERAGKKKGNKSRDADLDKESGLETDEKECSEDDDDGSCQKFQKADEEKLKTPTKPNKDPVTEKESSSETASTPPEVVRMRKEVKKLRVLIIRNLAQQITDLKKAKAEDAALKENTDSVARLQKEVQVLRILLPDRVTTRALEGSIDVDKVFQDPESAAVERATARIATHPRFVKKLHDVRQAIEEEKIKAAKAGEENKDLSKKMEDEDRDSEDYDDDDEEEEKTDSDDNDDNDEEGEGEMVRDDSDDNDEEEDEVKETTPVLKVVPRCNVERPPADAKTASGKEKSKGGQLDKVLRSPAAPKSISKPSVQEGPSLPSKSNAAAPPPRRLSTPDAKKPRTVTNKDESDLSDSDEEKEYFDDSTEERFHKQSSNSEQSDDDDFFLGKVSKLKKKKSDAAPRKEEQKTKNSDKEVRETPQFSMQSVFCSTLSKSSGSSQKGPKPPRFFNQKPSHDEEKRSWVKREGSGRGKMSPGVSRDGSQQKRGDKTVKPAFDRNKAGKSSQHALHPSWEASRKRKEQQAQITAFQGKKIKFDYDDD